MSYTQVNLAGLPAPSVIEELSFETIVQQMKDAVIAVMPAMAPVLQIEGEPATKVIEVCAAFVLITRARVNDAARGVMLAFATGTTLDHIGALFGVQRFTYSEATDNDPAVYETDDDFRARIQLATEGFSTAGPRGAYLFHTISAHPDVLDASIAGPNDGAGVAPGTVVVSVVSREGGGIPTAEVLDAVRAALNDRAVRPISDTVIVQAATPRPYVVTAVLHLDPEAPAQLIMDTARESLATYFDERRAAGGYISLSGIYAALTQSGVRRVELISPTADVTPSFFEYPTLTAVNLSTSVG